MKEIKLSAREIDFLSSVTEYFEESALEKDMTITRKKYKFTKEEMADLQEKLK